jgi:excinuclease UvrABC nuclease subunit
MKIRKVITEKPFQKKVESHVCGVYFIYFKNNHLYIGMSGDLKLRISTHNSRFEKYIKKIEYIKCNSLMKCKQLENKFIEKYKPDMNFILSYRFQAIKKIKNNTFEPTVKRKKTYKNKVWYKSI